ncbi:DUF808 domain-containing protein [Corynebacterium halotolerans]|uniref:ABC transporter n=1 Tax=Corynebacterium halotolerans YIM 70093 = DSM 44683 TaxID=1121362 RepID=M1NRF6_9CORY|nr:DUF808 domain-containing protein [Corynebacterium halotolerans]AGF72087.1 hypothetical protein A605_05405 [Corynebacterium halotolerans YIM 70093 = DSM 44683]
MAGGLVALLDDVALIARTAASSVDDVAAAAGRTSMKAAGVVVDDAAVTPRFVSGVTPARELPMIWRITKGSLINKLVIILPIALLLSWIAPWALTPILMVGGTYLCFEGAEKVLGRVLGHEKKEKPAKDKGPDAEDNLVKGAITTDLILSAEIMVISLNEVADETFLLRTVVLVLVALGITALVYGAVALLVKMDDIGLALVGRGGAAAGFGRGLVAAMPKVLAAISIVGTFAMLWVGGHIIVLGLEEFGLTWPYDFIHGLEVGAGGGFLGWLVNTFFSLIVGLIWGVVVVLLIEGIKKLTGAGREAHSGH